MLNSKRAAGIAGLAAAGLITAGCSAHAVDTSPAATTSASAGTSHAAAKASASPAEAGVGDTHTLTGNDSGEQVKVTLVKVIPTAQGADEFTTPDSGKRFYAAQFKLVNTGSKAYSDTPSNGSTVSDTSGQSYDSALGDDVSGCQAFASQTNLASGGTALGCVIYEVPKSAKIRQVQFTLDSGFADDTGQWTVSK